MVTYGSFGSRNATAQSAPDVAIFVCGPQIDHRHAGEGIVPDRRAIDRTVFDYEQYLRVSREHEREKRAVG